MQTAVRLPSLAPSDAQIDELEKEIDAIRAGVAGSLGASDERYIRRLLRMHRVLEIAGRVLVTAGLVLFDRGYVLACLGVLTLAAAKILDNMEIGHNVMHGQWNWLRDPRLRGGTWEWDNACPSEQWRHFHNVVHHDHTNVIGADRDLGFSVLRVSELQKWRPRRLAQPLLNVLLALLFEWGLAIHDVRLGRVRRGEIPPEELRRQLRQIGGKVGRQAAKDYLLWPLLAGPYFLQACLANLAANVIRNLWVYAIIFCGHFPASARVFTRDQAAEESRGRWYLRQIVGTCNIEGGPLFHLWTGNLGHQIEHHLFPDLPSNRYAEIAARVRPLCARLGIPYNTGRLTKQLAGVQWNLLRLSLPGRRRASA